MLLYNQDSTAQNPAKDAWMREMLKKGHEFSFFQAMRLLKRMLPEKSPDGKAIGSMAGTVHVRPKLSLDFPAADIDAVEQLDTGCFRLTATFLGLYGVSSPLPNFYTEDLLQEASSDESVARDFIDIFHQRLYELLFDGWRKYRLFLQVAEAAVPADFTRLFCLLGLGESELREDIAQPHALLRYAGILTQHPRSAMGLQTLLRDALQIESVDIIPCCRRWAVLPEDQRLCLGVHGHQLGVQAILGLHMEDRMGKFRIRIGPLREAQYRTFFPGGENERKLVFLTRLYLKDPLEFDLELIWAAGEVKTTCLGNPTWSMLGLDTWLFSGNSAKEERTVFFPEVA